MAETTMPAFLRIVLTVLKRIAQGFALLTGLIVLYLAYDYYKTTYYYNYKLTLEVEADGKVYSGSSIISVVVIDNTKALWVHPAWHSESRGGSPWVDLGEHGILLVSIAPAFYIVPDGGERPLGGGGFALAAYWGAKWPQTPLVSESHLRQIVKIKERGEVNLDMAQLMWMPNPNAPERAEFFPPKDRSELGTRGIKVRGLYVEMTKDRADDSKMYDKFPWLRTMTKTSPVVHQLPNRLNARTLLGDY